MTENPVYQVTAGDATYQVVTGVSWLYQHIDRESKEADNEAKKLIKLKEIDKPGFIVNRSGFGRPFYGFTNYPSGRGKFYSAAAIFACAQTNNSEYQDATWICVEELEETFWVALVHEGDILLESAGGLGKEKATETCSEYAITAEEEGYQLTYVGSGVKSLTGEESAISLANLLQTLDADDLDVALLRKDRTSVLIISALAVVAAGYLGYLALGYFNVLEIGKSEEDLRREQIRKATRIATEYYATMLQRPNLPDAINEAANAFMQRDLLDAPWPLVSSNCDTQSAMCVASFANERLLPLVTIKDHLAGKCDELSINAQGSTATCMYSVQYPESAGLMPESTDSFTSLLIPMTEGGMTTNLSDPDRSQISGASMAPADKIHRQGLFDFTGNLQDVQSYIEHYASGNALHWVKPTVIRIEATTDPLTNPQVIVEGEYVVQ